MLGPQLSHVQVRSRFSFAFTLPQTWDILLLGNHACTRVILAWRQIPLWISGDLTAPIPASA